MTARAPAFNYHAALQSSNPAPLCSRGYCSAPAEPDSDWCAGCGQQIETARNLAAERREIIAGRHRSITMSRTGPRR